MIARHSTRDGKWNPPVPDISEAAYSLLSDFSLARLCPVWFTAARNGGNAEADSPIV